MRFMLNAHNKARTCGMCGETIDQGKNALVMGGTTLCGQECIDAVVTTLKKWATALKALNAK